MSERSSGRTRKFDEPIALADRRRLVTLHDAANYITALPDEESSAAEWQAAIIGGPTMFVRIGRSSEVRRCSSASGDHRRSDDVRPHRHHARRE
jgi:hypothetical protein